MANFDQAPLVSFEQFAESLNGGMGVVSKMSQLDFFGKAALATSQASKKLGIIGREVYSGRNPSELFIGSLTPEGYDAPRLRVLSWDESEIVFVDHVTSFQGSPEEGVGSYSAMGMALKSPTDEAVLLNPFPAAFMSANRDSESYLLENGGSSLGPDSMARTVSIVNELYALMQDLRAA